MIDVLFNGKFLSQPQTGVQRTASELVAGVHRLICDDVQLTNELSCAICMPKNANRSILGSALKSESKGVLQGSLWEQLELPLYSREKILVNLCNQSPILMKRGITMIHDAQVFSSPKSYSHAYRSWYQVALPLMAGSSDKVLTVSEYSKQQLIKWKVADESKISVVYNGVDHVLRANKDPTILRKLNLTPKKYEVGLANTQEHKNIKVLLNAYSRQDMQSNLLVLFGGADMQSFQRIGIDVPANVKFAGYLDQSELSSLMENANAMLFPSLTEGFGLPPIEAMMLGTPTICAPCGALPEVCGSAALYRNPFDEGGWSEAVLTLNREAESARLNRSDACRRHAEKFTWHSASEKLLEHIVNCS